MKNTFIPSVNFHLTKACNMKCKYCFASFNNITSIEALSNKLKIIKQLYEFGFTKINFVGGEPLLVKDLPILIKFAKNLGFYTSIVTNGSLLSDKLLKQIYLYTDMIGLSIDSLNKENNMNIGRNTIILTPNQDYYLSLCRRISNHGIGLKINTVVSKYNFNENFTDFIQRVAPIRWKVFQVLEVKGENNIDNCKISKSEFNNFCERHKILNQVLIAESNDIIQGSYVMIDPEGHFYDNTTGKYTVSDKINIVGVEKALKQINFDYHKFIERQGNYYELLPNKNLA